MILFDVINGSSVVKADPTTQFSEENFGIRKILWDAIFR